MSDIFISYKREDREQAERLANALEKRGWSVWWDRELKGGDPFHTKISENLKRAKAVVVIWSLGSVNSRWVLDEADRAAHDQKLLPVKFDPMVNAPIGFGAFHVEDLSNWTDDPHHATIERLSQQINAISENRWKDTIVKQFEHGLPDVAKTAVSVQGFFGNLSTQIGGLPLDRLLFGAAGIAVAITLICAAALMVEAPRFAAMLFQGLVWTYLLFIVARIMHQFGIVSRGTTSRQFFDNDFSFWFLLSVLLSAFLTSAALILDDRFSISYFVIWTCALTTAFVFLSGLARVLISGSRLLLRRLS